MPATFPGTAQAQPPVVARWQLTASPAGLTGEVGRMQFSTTFTPRLPALTAQVAIKLEQRDIQSGVAEQCVGQGTTLP